MVADRYGFKLQCHVMTDLQFPSSVIKHMVPTTLQNSFSLTFQDKMNRFPWPICQCEIPMSMVLTSTFKDLQTQIQGLS